MSGHSAELHRRLREATRAAHHDLDHHPLLSPLVREDLTPRQYGHALVALHGVYSVLEEAVCGPAMAAGFDYASRRKVPAMEADLGELGLATRPCRVPVPAPADIGALVGILYTLEGSSLGAQVICRQLARVSGGSLPRRYFAGYGEETMARWQAFWAFAGAACPPEQADDACTAAVMAFRAIRRHLDAMQAELS